MLSRRTGSVRSLPSPLVGVRGDEGVGSPCRARSERDTVKANRSRTEGQPCDARNQRRPVYDPHGVDVTETVSALNRLCPPSGGLAHRKEPAVWPAPPDFTGHVQRACAPKAQNDQSKPPHPPG